MSTLSWAVLDNHDFSKAIDDKNERAEPAQLCPIAGAVRELIHGPPG